MNARLHLVLVGALALSGSSQVASAQNGTESWLICPGARTPTDEVFVAVPETDLRYCYPVSSDAGENNGVATADHQGQTASADATAQAETADASDVESPMSGLTTASRLSPTGRVLITLSSEPVGASILHGQAVLGRTEVTGLLKANALDEIRFELNGYHPCHFADGELSSGRFFCSMRPAQ